MPVTYPGSGVTITVEALLKQPRLIARALTDLVAKRFVADKIFAHGTPEQVAGGAALYQKSESIYPTQPAEEVGVRSGYPRTGWTEAVFAAMVHKYGLEVPISDEAQRRNQMDVVARAQRKLANALTKFVDTTAMTLILGDAAVLTGSASGDWTTAATDIVKDIATAKKAIYDQDEGYEPDTLVVNPSQELDLITDKDIRDALPRENAGQIATVTGKAVPLLGLSQILVTPQLTAGTALVLNAGVAGTIADEAPLSGEGYVSYAPGPGFATVYTKVYREDETDESIVRAARFPAMWIAEPKAIYKITGA
jgi:hypothetical protein